MRVGVRVRIYRPNSGRGRGNNKIKVGVRIQRSVLGQGRGQGHGRSLIVVRIVVRIGDTDSQPVCDPDLNARRFLCNSRLLVLPVILDLAVFAWFYL